jgi:hypothetical protein
MPESTFKFNGEDLTFSPEQDIGISELRHIKAWFPDLGDYQTFTMQASLGDPDAVACIIWIAQRKAGNKKVREPINFPDFSIGEVVGSFASDGVRTVAKVPPLRLMLNGEEYTFDIEKELTHKVLKQIKKWYPPLGSLVRFTVGMFRGDPDALACIAWICWGGPTDKTVQTPNQIDLAAGGLIDSYDFDEPEPPEEPDIPETRLSTIGDAVAKEDPPQPSDGKSSSEGIQTTSGDGSPTSHSFSASGRKKPSADRS